MSDDASEKHRGPAPKDAQLFASDVMDTLRLATHELAWLIERGYASPSALKLVGDRHALTARQRSAIERAAVPDSIAAVRRAHRVELGALRDRTLAIDGFNVLIVGESALSGAPIFVGRDEAVRDLGGVHGSWHRVSETERVIAALTSIVIAAGCARVRVFLDAPVSNSGRLRGMIEASFAAIASMPPFEVTLVPNADHALRAEADAVIASADGWVIDGATAWIELVRPIAEHASVSPWWVDLR
ncbi:MAG: DUF434 domain-containing protein [Deltaproteobacteria bacterium]|nr:DUF434 domain-containing protein [Deltaproteobacteria bacterium]